MSDFEELLAAKIVADKDIKEEYPEELNKKVILFDNFGESF